MRGTATDNLRRGRYSVALLLCTVLLTGCQGKALKLGIHPWIGCDVIPMAQQWGWMGPEVELVKTGSGAGAMAALASGELHAACLTLDEVIRGLDRGLPLSIIVVMDLSSGADSLLVRPDINAISQLQGRRIALETSGVSMLMLTAALASGGLSVADVELVDAAPTQLLELWQSGTVDAVTTYEPFTRALRSGGAATLLSSRDTPELIFDVIAVHRDAMAGRQKTLEKLVSAVLRAQAHVHEDPIDALYRLASLHERPVRAIEEELRQIVVPTRDAQYSYFERDSSLRAAVQRINGLFVDARIIDRPQSHARLLDSRFLPEPGS
ncbi:MAG: ABC transporter substrate-binding protein [Chromatocurvus sp.]